MPGIVPEMWAEAREVAASGARLLSPRSGVSSTAPNGPNGLCALWRGVGMVEHMFEMRAAVIAGELDGLSVPASADAIVCARGLLDRLSALVADAERV
jgi:hypothetical protein